MYCAEYLSSINTLSVLLDYSEAVQDIKGLAVNEFNQLILKTSNNEYGISLPISVHDLKVTSINQIKDCLSLKLQISSEIFSAVDKTESFVRTTDFWWSCSDLKKKTPSKNNTNDFYFRCIQCSASLIHSTEYKFLDMPSEYWYELMDIWHCHKPHLDESKKEGNKYDGSLKPNKNNIILGSYYLLSNFEDTSSVLEKKSEVLHCVNCHKDLGRCENGHNKLFKWNLALTFGDKVEYFPKYVYIYNLIMDKINLSATRKFKLKIESLDQWLYIWVTNVGIDVSVNGRIINNSLKLVYYLGEEDKDSSFLHESVEVLNVSDDIIIEFIYVLKKSNDNLPDSNKRMTVADNNVLRNYSISYISPDSR